VAAGKQNSKNTKAPVTQSRTKRDQVPPIGRVLRRAREYRKLSIREVERRLGRSSAYLSQVERGVIRQPDPVVLLELADLYELDFMTLAAWAGWADESSGDRTEVASLLITRILELDDAQRTQVLSYIERIISEPRS
jgi:transcriptional regulator with XRE-family HTH domain